MKQDDQNIQPEGFDANRVSYLLDSAALAEQGGNSRLAIHLYCAAFEASQENEEGIDERTLTGLRQAWTLACQQGDRATAETIFNDLAPYNSDEQTRAALSELQDMASVQLGLKREELEDMAVAFADEIREAGIDVDSLVERFDDIHNQHMGDMPFVDLASSLQDHGLQPGSGPMAPSGPGMGPMNHNAPGEGPLSSSGPGSASDSPDGEFRTEDMPPELRYASLAGFERTKETMRTFGIVDPADYEMQDFLQQAESFHGVSGPVLSQNFLFVGSSREDCGIFAQATASEIGWPSITMVVELNELGDGTIKVMAPVKRSFFGPPRLTELPNPCTLIIQNIDILQDLFWSEEQAIAKGQAPFGFRHTEDFHRTPPGMPAGGGHGHSYPRSLQHEILGYLGTLLARGGVFVIATSAASSAKQPLVLSEQLESLLGKPVEIPIDSPTQAERHRVLTFFSEEHPSFHDLDLPSLARLSEGMSRYEIFVSCSQAVESAYSESLKKQQHRMVTLGDVLTQFMQYLKQDSPAHKLVEDYLVALFAADLETELFIDEIIPNQISIEFDAASANGHTDDKAQQKGEDDTASS